MVLAALLISSLVIILAAGAIIGGQQQLREQRRVALGKDLGFFCDDIKAIDHERVEGRYEDIEVAVHFGHAAVSYTFQLPAAVMPYTEIVDRWASPALKRHLVELEMTLDAKDRITGLNVVEPGRVESISSLRRRLVVAAQVRDLRQHVPGELVSRIPQLRSSGDLDRMLNELCEHYPDAPELGDAFRLGCHRFPGPKLIERAKQFLDASEIAGLVAHH